MSTAEQIRTMVIEYNRRVWNEHEVEAVHEFSPEQTLLLDPDGDYFMDREGLKERIREVLRMIDGHRLDIGTIVAGQDSVIFTWEAAGNWRDGERGVFPVRFGGVTYWKIVDGRIAERDGISDMATLGYQLGVHKRRIRVLMPV
ncbi:nuclear transport factor 2 family protein [Crossiella sp. CA198]|uniref:nuclear transport factor 2 family protein n=1 Tax=Crossiella sp. CA198 TaxID=3455607 RepID=UPI003F8D5801